MRVRTLAQRVLRRVEPYLSNSTEVLGVPVPVARRYCAVFRESALQHARSARRCDDAQMNTPPPDPSTLSQALPATAREVEEFVASAGWDQQPQLFALVATATLLASQPELADQLDAHAALTPVAQEALPQGELDLALAGIEWPDSVAGCALAQEIVILPPAAEADLGGLVDDPAQARHAAAGHPQRREGRLVAAVLRDGTGACVLRLRPGSGNGQRPDELVEDSQLAPNLLHALLATLH